MIKNKKHIYTIVLVFSIFLLTATATLAQSSLLDNNTLKAKFSATCISNGDCSVNDFIVIAVRLSEIILGITGSLALLAFVYGGFVFLLSGGSAQNVEKGKGILKAAIIGLVIVFASYSIIRFVMGAAGLDWQGDTNTPTPQSQGAG